MNDSPRIVNLLKSGDLSTESALVHKYNARLFTYFRSRIKGEDNYEDLVQEVFVSFFEAVKKGKIHSDDLIAPFIFGIAKRIIYNFFYKKKKGENIRKKVENEHNPFVDFAGEEALWNEKMVGMINKHIETLKEIDKVILKEFFFNDNSIGEISVLINRPKHYVSVRKERALKKIKSEIMETEGLYK